MSSELARDILNALLDKYERSVLSKEGSEKHLSVKLGSSDPVFKKLKNDPLKYHDDYDEAVNNLASKNIVDVDRDSSERIDKLVLRVEAIEAAYSFCNRQSPKDACQKAIDVLKEADLTQTAEAFGNYVRDHIATRFRIPATYFSEPEELAVLLHTVNAMESQDDEILERDFSVRVLGDSKSFGKIRSRVCRIFRDFCPDVPDETDDGICQYCNILKNPTRLLVKNRLVFQIRKQKIDLDQFGFDFGLTDEMIREMEILPSSVTKVITIENLTTFNRFCDDDALVIYLAGFHNHTKRDFLQKVFEAFPSAEYLHFSDIDCGGFLILNHLRKETRIPFKPFRMGIEDLKSAPMAKTLTENDRKRLKQMILNPDFEEFYPTMRYMLKNDIKLEQESLD